MLGPKELIFDRNFSRALLSWRWPELSIHCLLGWCKFGRRRLASAVAKTWPPSRWPELLNKVTKLTSWLRHHPIESHGENPEAVWKWRAASSAHLWANPKTLQQCHCRRWWGSGFWSDVLHAKNGSKRWRSLHSCDSCGRSLHQIQCAVRLHSVEKPDMPHRSLILRSESHPSAQCSWPTGAATSGSAHLSEELHAVNSACPKAPQRSHLAHRCSAH